MWNPMLCDVCFEGGSGAKGSGGEQNCEVGDIVSGHPPRELGEHRSRTPTIVARIGPKLLA